VLRNIFLNWIHQHFIAGDGASMPSKRKYLLNKSGFY